MSEIYFSQIREDSLVEREITKDVRPKKIAVIGSGGCTAFSVLGYEVEQVLCVDLNPAQCALIELKKAGIKYLSRVEYLAFIGEAPCEKRLQIYKYLSDSLSKDALRFWEQHPDYIMQGINHCGVNERFYRFIGESILNNVYDKTVWNELFKSKSIQEQHAFYDNYLTTPEWKTAIYTLLSKTTHLQFFPAYMFTNASENDFSEYFMAQFEKEVKTKHIQSNFFLSQILFSSYLYDQEEGMPYYLTEEGFEAAKQNSEKLFISSRSLQEVLRTEKQVDAFYLSNVFDWATETGKEEICRGMLDSKSDDAVVLYRNMLSSSPLPTFFQNRFVIHKEQSAYYEKMERSMLYQKVTVGRLL
ncbi:DUF3419 family protein [Fredinandcohnia humi]